MTVGRHLGRAIEISLKVADFRNGSITVRRFRPAPISGHSQGQSVCLKGAIAEVMASHHAYHQPHAFGILVNS